ncbi:MAG: tetratricopeptide repeat protein [Anaerolineae bacterium]|nr:tetratricopeptide repeat protein [Anaerolineae bacterium]
MFVARERELDMLAGYLDRALVGKGTVCFVTGDAGSGKTTLVTEFARRVQERRSDLLVAFGQSDAQTGAGDAYLPFREVLGQLTGDVEAELARGAISHENAGRLRRFLRLSGEALVEVGPDLVGVFVPGAGLAMRVGSFVAEKVGWLDKLRDLAQRQREGLSPAERGIEQSHIFEQYTNVLTALAAKQPLMLVLDDLQWADGASIELLFRLGRRVGESRILIVGTYRADEVALGRAGERHPLEEVSAELKRYYGDVTIPLGEGREAERRRFLDAFVDTEPNLLGASFREALYHHTDGHPLFTIELLRDMQERGDLIQDALGRWVEGPVLDWAKLPARVEGVIEARIGRLEAELREALNVASVEGEDFTAEVAARVQETDVRGLIRRLSGQLEKRHRLVNAQGVRRLDGQRLSLYRFQHNLFQTYLYAHLDEVERTLLHEDVGRVLEELYGEQRADIAVQLARHFSEAGIAEKARTYLREAGDQAAAQYANHEALQYYSQALELTEAGELEERYDLLAAREKLLSLKGDRAAQRRDLDELAALADALDDDARRAEVALRRGHYAGRTGDYAASLAAAQEAVRLAQAAHEPDMEAEGWLQCGQARFHEGAYGAARDELEQALALARARGARRTEADAVRSLGNIGWVQGDHADARLRYEQSLEVACEIGYRRAELGALNNLSIVTGAQGDCVQAEAYTRRTLQVARTTGDRWCEGMVLNNLGVQLQMQGDYVGAMSLYEEALVIRRVTGDPMGEALTLMNIARLFAEQGQFDRSRPFYQECLDRFRETGDRQGEAEALAFLSLSCHQFGENEAALEHAQRALAITREMGDRNTEADPLAYLGHALAGLGRMAEAADAYRQALDMRREFGQAHMATEPLAGLARIALAQGDVRRAQAYVEQILTTLDEHTLEGTAEPLRVYLTCYRVLHAGQDPRASELLRTAYGLLQEKASRIQDRALRRSFLENVGTHCEIVRAFASSG